MWSIPLMTGNIGISTATVNGFLTAFPGTLELVCSQAMTEPEDILARIDRRLDAVGLSASAASEKAGLSKDAIRNIRRGLSRGGKVETLQKLAPVLDTTLAFLLGHDPDPSVPQPPAPNTVPLVGYVSAGAAHFVPSGQLGRVARPEWATDRTVAVEVRGESLGPLFDRWLAYYDDVRTPVTTDLIARLCVVWLADGRVLVKQLRRGTKPGRFDLISQNEKPMKNEAVDAAARVKQLVPR